MKEASLIQLAGELSTLEHHITETAKGWQHWLDAVDPRHFLSARNLLRYIALRQIDLRKIQLHLGQIGLTLSQCEKHVMRNLREVRARIGPQDGSHHIDLTDTISWTEAKDLSHRNSRAVFGLPAPDVSFDEPHQAIMVTADYPLVTEVCEKIQAAGANVLRINAAHGGTEQWREMCGVWREVSEASGRQTKIMVDVAGPKLRTGRVRMPEPFLKFQPARSFDGTVLTPFRVRVTAASSCSVGQGLWTVPFDVASGALEVRDSRGRKRLLPLEKDADGQLYASGDRTCYLKAGCRFTYLPDHGDQKTCVVDSVAGGDSQAFLRKGDTVHLVDSFTYENSGFTCPTVECLEPGIFPILLPDRALAFDDGRIGCRVVRSSSGFAELIVDHACKPVTRLRSDKGINTPDHTPSIPLLSAEDLAAIAFGLQYADILSFSFIRSAADVETAAEAIESLGGSRDFPVVLKIETVEGFANLPAILLTAMKRYPVAVMIARGDLAVEVGFMRSGEVQEQILSLAEAAHMPAVLATEVLSSMLSTGTPSRAEVTDAAMSVRAECVMLNKGPYVVETVRALRDMLVRMQSHRYKNLEIFRPTAWSRTL